MLGTYSFLLTKPLYSAQIYFMLEKKLPLKFLFSITLHYAHFCPTVKTLQFLEYMILSNKK